MQELLGEKTAGCSQLKRGIVGTWHKVSPKHLPAYLDEMCFRFNNRKNQFLFRDTLIKLILSPNIEYKNLTDKVEDASYFSSCPRYFLDGYLKIRFNGGVVEVGLKKLPL